MSLVEKLKDAVLPIQSVWPLRLEAATRIQELEAELAKRDALLRGIRTEENFKQCTADNHCIPWCKKCSMWNELDALLEGESK